MRQVMSAARHQQKRENLHLDNHRETQSDDPRDDYESFGYSIFNDPFLLHIFLIIHSFEGFTLDFPKPDGLATREEAQLTEFTP